MDSGDGVNDRGEEAPVNIRKKERSYLLAIWRGKKGSRIPHEKNRPIR